jgi:hypothetical protein
MPHHQNPEQTINNKKTGNQHFENVAKFKYLTMTASIENFIHEKQLRD